MEDYEILQKSTRVQNTMKDYERLRKTTNDYKRVQENMKDCRELVYAN